MKQEWTSRLPISALFHAVRYLKEFDYNAKTYITLLGDHTIGGTLLVPSAVVLLFVHQSLGVGPRDPWG